MMRWGSGMALALVLTSATTITQAGERPAALRVTPLVERLRAETQGPAGALNLDPRLYLAGENPSGRPVYYEAHNLIAARTIHLDQLWPGGGAGANLTGAGAGILGMWDSGAPRSTHQEFSGRVLQQDDASSITSHSTAVAGILVAQGLNAAAHGMAPAAQLKCWDWNDDQTEMMDASWRGLRISNHSYGAAVGWGLVGNSWYWYGDVGLDPREDVEFGYYNLAASQMDELSWLEPRYLMVRSAGNHRFDTGPAPGQPHFVFEGGSWQLSFDERDSDGGATGFDSLPPEATPKNGLVVGAVEDLPLGWLNPTGVLLTNFTSFGPTDDGRIKPDVVANGTSLLSTARTGDADYAQFSGTSASSPCVAGALTLLSGVFSLGHLGPSGSPLAPYSSTMKGLLLHTANEVGPAPGPDYQAGWGLVDARAAYDLLLEDNARHRRILEGSLGSNSQKTFIVRSLGGPVRLTLAWTDYPAVPLPSALDNPTPRLVHDLDLSVQSLLGVTTQRSWALDPALPDHPAQALGNHLDNVERIDWQPQSSGEYQRIVVRAGNLLANQRYSLLLTGVEPVAKLSFLSSRTAVDLGDTLWLDVELDGGLAVRGVDLDVRWPAGALRFLDMTPGPVLLEGGFTPTSQVLEAGISRAHLILDREGDLQGLTLPSGTLAQLRFVVQSLSEVNVDLSASRLISVTGDLDQALDSAGYALNVGTDPPDLELGPEELGPSR